MFSHSPPHRQEARARAALNMPGEYCRLWKLSPKAFGRFMQLALPRPPVRSLPCFPSKSKPTHTTLPTGKERRFKRHQRRGRMQVRMLVGGFCHLHISASYAPSHHRCSSLVMASTCQLYQLSHFPPSLPHPAHHHHTVHGTLSSPLHQILIKASPLPPLPPSPPSFAESHLPPRSSSHSYSTQTLTGRKQSFNFEPEEKVCVACGVGKRGRISCFQPHLTLPSLLSVSSCRWKQ